MKQDRKLSRRIRDDRGVTSVEYGLIAAAIAAVIVIIVFALGANVVALFDHFVNKLVTYAHLS
jgi:pilus assembly protein Flp/PilA